MATTFKLKRKTFSESEEKKKNSNSSFGKKLAIGVGIAGTLAGGFYGAKKGYLGSGAQKWAGKTTASVGKLLGSEAIMKSGAQSYGQGAAKQIANDRAALIASGVTKKPKLTQAQIDKKASILSDAMLKSLKKENK